MSRYCFGIWGHVFTGQAESGLKTTSLQVKGERLLWSVLSPGTPFCITFLSVRTAIQFPEDFMQSFFFFFAFVLH